MNARSLLLITSLCSWLCAACSPITIKAEYTAIGAITQAQPGGHIVNSAADVQVFYASSPAGFSLRENELKVEPGYSHRILGILKVRTVYPGFCRLLQRDAITALQEGAYANGANAVVYATTPLTREQGDGTACVRASEQGEFGSGWAVILGEAPPAPTAPVPAMPSAAPPPPAPVQAPATAPK